MQHDPTMNIPRSLAFAYVLLTTAANCGSDPTVADCDAHSPSIATGFAGCVSSEDDVGNPPPPPSVKPGFGVDVFVTQPSTDLNDGARPEFTTQTGADGFYEITVTPGHYWVCTTFRRCIEQDVQPMTVRRLDYAFSVGPGWSEPRP
jgi:hypothetical protein